MIPRKESRENTIKTSVQLLKDYKKILDKTLGFESVFVSNVIKDLEKI